MAKPRNKYVDYVAYLAARVLAMVVQMVPLRWAYGLANLAGWLMYRLDRHHRKIAEGQLRLSFPDWPDERITRCACRSMQAMACLGVETLLLPKLITTMTWRRHVRFAGLTPVLTQLLERKTGIILLTGHFGNWEIAGYTMATLGFPSVSVARPLDNPYLNDFILGVRERTGQSILLKKGATGNMDEVLEGKSILGFIADQDAGRRGEFVNFFGRPASTFKSIALMALRHEVPVVVGFARRTAPGEFEVGVERIIQPADWHGQDDEVHWLTQEFTAGLEAVVRRTPEQYFWVHRRWKHRPDGTRVAGLGIA